MSQWTIDEHSDPVRLAIRQNVLFDVASKEVITWLQCLNPSRLLKCRQLSDVKV